MTLIVIFIISKLSTLLRETVFFVIPMCDTFIIRKSQNYDFLRLN